MYHAQSSSTLEGQQASALDIGWKKNNMINIVEESSKKTIIKPDDKPKVS